VRINKRVRKIFAVTVFFAVTFLVAIISLDIEASAQQEVDFPDPSGFVNDFADILDKDKEDELESKLRSFANEESTEIFVITVDQLPEGTDIYNFVPRLTDSNPVWRAGQDEYDNGIIFTVVMGSREMAIDVGYGLEGALPDITAKQILDDEVRPYFKNRDYNGGIAAGVASIKSAVKGEYEGSGQDNQEGGDGELIGQLLTFGFIGVFFVIPYLAAFLGRTKSWWLGGVLGFVAGIVISSVLIFVLAGPVRFLLFCFLVPGLTVAGLFFDFILSRNYKARKKKGLSTSWFNSFGGFSSGGSSGFGSSSFGGGGFSGGSGGSFGGGGARSSW
jgi:uncharacterized protein